jgi:hypothetical protein
VERQANKHSSMEADYGPNNCYSNLHGPYVRTVKLCCDVLEHTGYDDIAGVFLGSVRDFSSVDRAMKAVDILQGHYEMIIKNACLFAIQQFGDGELWRLHGFVEADRAFQSFLLRLGEVGPRVSAAPMHKGLHKGAGTPKLVPLVITHVKDGELCHDRFVVIAGGMNEELAWRLGTCGLVLNITGFGNNISA